MTKNYIEENLDRTEWHFDFETENRWMIDDNNEKSENIRYRVCSV